MEFFTIGVYNSTEEAYFKKLTDNRIDTFCDIRQRRGVRGSKYAFVNSNRLQSKLNEFNISYGHVVALAPTSEIRELQKGADNRTGEIKHERKMLSSEFIAAFKAHILNKFDIDRFVNYLEKAGANRVVLFCVEEIPEACHRSLISNRLQELGYKITHL